MHRKTHSFIFRSITLSNRFNTFTIQYIFGQLSNQHFTHEIIMQWTIIIIPSKSITKSVIRHAILVTVIIVRLIRSPKTNFFQIVEGRTVWPVPTPFINDIWTIDPHWVCHLKYRFICLCEYVCIKNMCWMRNLFKLRYIF